MMDVIQMIEVMSIRSEAMQLLRETDLQQRKGWLIYMYGSMFASRG